jgi:hypothetical protein
MLAQVSMLNGMFSEDLNGDGNLDLICATNDYGTEVSVGRYDALNGLVLLGDGSGNFSAQSIASSGFYVPGNGKSLVCMIGPDQTSRLAVSQNRGALQWFNWKATLARVQPASDDTYALISLTNGKQRKQERYWGSGFLSQSPFLLFTNQQVKQIEYFTGSKTGSK